MIDLAPGQATPAPWTNIVANERFGFIVTESGGGYTWAENSRENRLTPWSNDPVSDPPGEALYLRDEDERRALVAHAAAGRRRVTSASGMASATARSTQRRHDITSELRLSVAPDDPVKIFRLRLKHRRYARRGVSA